MHQITALLLALLFLTFTGCEDKKPDENTIPVENTTEIVEEEKYEKEMQVVKEVKSTSAVTINTSEETFIEPKKNIGDTFELLDTQKKTYTATVAEEGLILKNNEKSIVLLQLFATWCDPCLGEIAYLNDLQEIHEEDLFIAGVLTRDTIAPSTLNAFIKEHHINYKILQSDNNDALAEHIARELDIQGTFPIPLIVLYLDGEYYTHYEGSVPVEMVKYDIKQAQQQLQKNQSQR
ncbi:TlpA disulfide reductase family protein [Sulfurovum sp.]|uniref:TlpA family protein disulfide reductase n=1 Tax=Sulfurovum sp. TaxID=1969726 RepID=UPI00286810ED|nr:TlpA disulfide reductase family protein [Sulfurovum sp.]